MYYTHSSCSDASVCNWSRLLVLTTTPSGVNMHAAHPYTLPAFAEAYMHTLVRAGACMDVRATRKETGMVELGERGHITRNFCPAVSYTNQITEKQPPHCLHLQRHTYACKGQCMCVQHQRKLAWWNLEKEDTSPRTFVQLYHTQTKDEARPKRNSPYIGTFPATGYMHDDQCSRSYIDRKSDGSGLLVA